MDIYIYVIIGIGILIFYVVSFQSEFRKWRKGKSKNNVGEEQGKVVMSLFGIPIIRRK